MCRTFVGLHPRHTTSSHHPPPTSPSLSLGTGHLVGRPSGALEHHLCRRRAVRDDVERVVIAFAIVRIAIL